MIGGIRFQLKLRERTASDYTSDRGHLRKPAVSLSEEPSHAQEHDIVCNVQRSAPQTPCPPFARQICLVNDTLKRYVSLVLSASNPRSVDKWA